MEWDFYFDATEIEMPDELFAHEWDGAKRTRFGTPNPTAIIVGPPKLLKSNCQLHSFKTESLPFSTAHVKTCAF